MSRGFIPVKRSLFRHFLFNEHRVFSRFEAWLDLIQLASFTDGQTDMIKGKPVTRNRGEIVASIRWMANRWNWSIHKTFDYIEVLRSLGMVVVGKESGFTKITLVNFEKHNSIGEEEKMNAGNGKGNGKSEAGKGLGKNQGTQQGTQTGTLGEQSGNAQGTNNNKDNNLKKLNGEGGAAAPSPPGVDFNLEEKQKQLLERKDEFYRQLAPHVQTYSKGMIRAFFNHWVQPNSDKTRMKFEQESFWDLSHRLTSWADKDVAWKKSPKPGEGNPPAKAPPGLSKAQIDLNYLFGRYLEGAITAISIDPILYTGLKNAGLISFTEEETEKLRTEAQAYMKEKSFPASVDTETKYMKKFAVLEFFNRMKAQGKETVFHVD